MIKKIILILFNLINIYCFSFLLITDIHVDMKYNAGSASKCLEFTKLGTMCCRKLDIPIKGSIPCNKWGDLNNDIPPLLFESIINWTKINLNFDFIINTGDSGSHKDINQIFTSDNEDSINFVSDIIDKYYPKKKIYNVVGNHDSYWNVDQTFPGYSKFLKRTTKKWSKWINDGNMSLYGYYSDNLNNDIKIITFNSLYYDKNNLFEINSSKKDIKESNNQIKWLENEFDICYKNKKKVIFLNHIPLFGSESNSYMNDNLSRILSKYNKTILLNLNGHSHSGRYNLYFNRTSNSFTNFGIINPSIYTDNHYPSFRIYKYNNGIIDYDNYYCNISKIIENDIFECEKGYSFLDYFNLSNLDLKNLIILYNKIKNDKSYLYKYVKYYSIPNLNFNYNYTDEILINNNIN